MQGVGIDFGTSNSSVALFDGETLQLLKIDPAAARADVMPTALHLSRALSGTVGQAAIDRYIRENGQRRVTLEREQVGVVQICVSDTDLSKSPAAGSDGVNIAVQVHAFTDQGLPGRLFRGVKRWLGSAKIDAVRVFDGRFRLVALITPVLEHLVRSARDAGALAKVVHVGRPVHYEGGGERSDRTAAQRMHEACGHARLHGERLYPEPVAAARSYLQRARDAGERTVLAYDFGGGTLDLALLRARGADFEILATHGTGLGGDEINRMICRAHVFPELGEGLEQHIPVDASLKRVRFPFDRFADRLLNWTLAYELNRPELCELIAQGMREGPDARRRLQRLFELVTRNQAYPVFQAIERAKLQLSSAPIARIQVEELDLDVPITRCQLERLLAPSLERIGRLLDELLERAGLHARDVDVVVRTGGSSHIPIVVAQLEDRFPRRVVEHDAFTSIAAGLAIASWQSARA